MTRWGLVRFCLSFFAWFCLAIILMSGFEYHLCGLVLMTAVCGDVLYASVVCTRLSAHGLVSGR